MSAAKGRWVHVPGEPKPKEKAMGMSRKQLLWLLILFVFGLLVGVFGQDTWASVTGSSARSKAFSAVKNMLLEQQEAWNKGDINGFLSHYEMTDDITFYVDDVVSTGWMSLRDRFTKSYVTNKKPMGQLEFTDVVYVPLNGEAVMVRGRWTTVLSDGKTRGGLFTILVKKTDTGWKIVHDHTSDRKEK